MKVGEIESRKMKGLWNLPEGWEWQELGKVCQVNPRRPPRNRTSETVTSFLPMSGVDDKEGVINNLEKRSYQEVARGFTYFEEGDVLFAKITPCMENGKSVIACDLIDKIGFGSTEFHVLRPRESVIAEWIHKFIRRLSFRQEAKKHFKGAVGQQRVSSEFLTTSLVPIPSDLEIQRRIVARIETLLAEVKDSRSLLDEIRQDANKIIDMVLEKVYKELELSQVILKPLGSLLAKKPQYGISEKASATLEGIPILRMGNITTNGKISMEKLKYIQLSPADEKKYLLQDGDILFNRTNSAELVGKSAIFEGYQKAVFASYLIRLTAEQAQVKPKYLNAYINSAQGRAYIQSQLTRAIGQVNVNTQKLAAMPVPLPEIQTQERIIAYFDTAQNEVDEILKLLDLDAKLVDLLEQSILEQAFRGEL